MSARCLDVFQKATMKYFDCNCSYGVNPLPAFRYARSPDELLDEMDFCGIDQALVYHSNMRFGNPIAYNQRLMEEIKTIRRLSGTWAILPPQTGEGPEPEELLRNMRANSIRALRAFPQEHRYRLDARTFGDLLEVLTERHIPLFIKENLIDIGDLLADFPALTVVAVNQGPHSFERYLRPLIETYPNLYIDTSYYIIAGAIEDFCNRYGHERLLFGSAFPDNCSGGAILQLMHCDIDEASKRAVAAENLERLLAEAVL